MIGLRTIVIAGMIGAWAAAALAGEVQDQLFATGVLGSVPDGARLVYTYDRRGSFEAADLAKIEDGWISVAITEGKEGTRAAAITIDDTRRRIQPDPMGASAGNPVLLVFMEDVVRSVAGLTGGSPFYIRNRLREALRTQGEADAEDVTIDGDPTTGTRLVFQPFAAEDPARLGPLAPLELTFVMTPEIPGHFVLLSARTPAGTQDARYLDLSVALIGLEDGDAK